MSRRLQLAVDESARTACAQALLRGGMVEKTGEVLPVTKLTERVGWAADLVWSATWWPIYSPSIGTPPM